MSIFFVFGGCSVLDTDFSILQLGGLYTFIASDLWPERRLISMSSNPELNKIVHNVTFPEWFVMLRTSKKIPYQIIRLYRHYYTLIFPRNKRFRCRRRQWGDVINIITTHTCNVTWTNFLWWKYYTKGWMTRKTFNFCLLKKNACLFYKFPCLNSDYIYYQNA